MNRKIQHMTRLRGFLASLILSTLIFAPMIWAADPADADSHVTVIEFTGEDFYIPRPADATDQEGVERLLTTFPIEGTEYEDLIGTTCLFSVTAANGSSVHVNNYGLLQTNGSETDILKTEDQPNVLATVLTDSTLMLGSQIQLFNIMQPDADGIVATSVAYTVRVTCQDDTTTTTSSSSTTSSSTATTTPQATTSTPPTSSTTSIPPATSTTAPTDSTTTTSPPSTSTTAPDGSTSTTAPPTESTEPPPSTPPTLPNTGPPDVAVLVGAGLALLTLGGGIVRAVRES